MTKKELIFVPLGGAGEIGMNLNLYGYGKPEEEDWLIVDYGITFGDDTTPGIDVILPDPTFIEQRKDKIKGMVITHAHEDHIGALAYMWDRVQCPVYCTPFTATLARGKLKEAGFGHLDIVHEIPLGGTFNLDPFEVEFITFTHSILEPNALAIRTAEGTVVHTGDWKLDDGPVIGRTTDVDRLSQIGKEGVLALICDSTNVFSTGKTGSEEDLEGSLTELIGSYKTGKVCVTCFASNLARLHTIAVAAKENGRQIVVSGRSFSKMMEAAHANGYMMDTPDFLSEDEARHIPDDELLVICTGSQGEPRAALARIASGQHKNISLGDGDVVIFSSRTIPGNEKSIYRIQNELARKGIEIVTSHDHFVHVSGHPAQDELRELFRRVQPQIAVPVHGEFRHLQAHAALAEDCGVKKAFVIENGNVVKLEKDMPCIIDEVETGRLAWEGRRAVPMNSEVVQTRKRALFNGSCVVSVAVDGEGKILSEPIITTEGLLDPDGDDDLWDQLFDIIYNTVDSMPKRDRKDDAVLEENLRLNARRWFRKTFGKRAITHIHLLRV
ncbi:Predicted hydrolase of the metallo-beta-lactamase superfamily [Candidatus Terasakiella magnetica]|uniref:Predicted hydrolase of the metallo-beta-lactamase superfamily n=1 Tax=Candidatus Terasakiella magnetica TaxID=1867952 RepID=A0A1C3RCP6_9PROT|nr:ribonuclease J [Candidatus Terasakiella magnetica]SCA55004.1 Predicted hydrolase of the metallo-beta-lactamase superfamily [Candidatus Terasakiella magnetica]